MILGIDIFCVILLVWTWSVSVRARPAAQLSLVNDDSDQDISIDLVNYLGDFGYLGRPKDGTSNMASLSSVRSAVRHLQEFAGIPVTGRMNDATAKLMQSKRCGMPDIPPSPDHSIGGRRHKRFALQGAKWPNTTLTYSLHNYPSGLGKQDVERVMYDALNHWATVSALSFHQMPYGKADMNISFVEGEHGDGYPFDGPDIVLAHAFYPGPGIGGDVHFDDSERWALNTPEADIKDVNMLSVAAHEFGHSLGLSHSREQGALMFPYYRYGYVEPNDLLNYDDILAIQHLYGAGGASAPTKPPSTTSGPITTQPPTTVPPPVDQVPDECQSAVDAVSRIRNEIFVFRRRWFWRLDSHGYLVASPMDLERFWNGFPDDVESIDAVYERPNTDTIVFFIGRQYWEFQANNVKAGFPKNLTALGIDEAIDKLDAAFVWDYNQATYFFAGDKYWKFDEVDQKVEVTYPRSIQLWNGLPADIGAAFTNASVYASPYSVEPSASTFFFKNNLVYKFNTFLMRVETGYPVEIVDFWSHCRLQAKQLTANANQPLTTNLLPLILMVLLIVDNYLL